MYRNSLILLTSLIYSCTEPADIGVKDLIFTDYESHYLSKHNIDSTLLISNNYNIKWGWSDTIGYVTYDSKGRILTDNSDQHETYKYDYDSIGLKKYTYWLDWDIVYRLNAVHNYLKDSLILYETWNQGQNTVYTCRYKFNTLGLLTEEMKYGSAIVDKKEVRVIKYDKNNKLSSEEIVTWNFENKKKIYYSTNKLNSVVNNVKEFNSATKVFDTYKMIDYYDKNGLIFKTVKQDSLTIHYVHFTSKSN